MTEQLEISRTNLGGAVYAIAAFLTWGLLPLYWKLLKQVPAMEILLHRIFWSFIFMAAILFWRGEWEKLRAIGRQPKKMGAVALAAVLVSLNWGIYIWAVNADHVVDTSLGYYINPLLSILLGLLVLGERLNFWQMLSLLLAFLGVLVITFQYGKIPWIALSLAVSFGLYGLVKKMANLESTVGLALETLVLMPAAAGILAYLHIGGKGSFGQSSPLVTALLAVAGVVTALPLLWFARATQRIPLSAVGFFQYLTPTMMLLLGVFLYGEPFTKMHLVGFALIWVALGLFSLSQLPFLKTRQPQWLATRGGK